MIIIIEIVILIGCVAAFREAAKRRGTHAWPYILVGILGWLVARFFACLAIGVGPGILVSWVWVGIAYFSIFLVGGRGRRMEDSWQCPICRGFNSPTTLVCLCGYKPDIGEKPALEEAEDVRRVVAPVEI